MRKILLGTTAVAGAALFAVSTAQAQQALTVRIGGYFEFSAGYINDTLDRAATSVTSTTGGNAAILGTTSVGTSLNPYIGAVAGSTNRTGNIVQPLVSGAAATTTGTTLRNARAISRDRTDLKTDAEIHIFVDGKAANGLSYGAVIELEVDAWQSQSGLGGGTNPGSVVGTDEMWGYVSSPTLGTLRFGDEDNAASLMAVSIPGVTQLGLSTQWDEFVGPNEDGTRYLVTDINDGNDSTKLIYMSPQFAGFDFGISFAPNRREGEGFLSVNSSSSATPAIGGATNTIAPNNLVLQRDRVDSIRNEMSYAVRYRGSFGGIGVAASFGAMFADAQANNGVVFNSAAVGLQNVTQYQAGLTLTGFGVTVGGQYSQGKFGGAAGTAIRDGLDDSKTWAIGASYVTGPLSFGAFYSVATRDNGTSLAAGGAAAASTNPDDRQQTVWGIGGAYTLAPGMDLFANYTNVQDRNIANSTSNPTAWAASGRNRDIEAFVVGTRLSF